jgi:predicted DNA-binding ribbon-helix-helix protein
MAGKSLRSCDAVFRIIDVDVPMALKKSLKQISVREVERIQTGVRLEKRLLKVLKGLAEYLDLSLGDLLEGIALHAIENKLPFKPVTLEKAAQLRRVYGLDLVAADSHRLRDKEGADTQG